jgi:hypothetical protein
MNMVGHEHECMDGHIRLDGSSADVFEVRNIVAVVKETRLPIDATRNSHARVHRGHQFAAGAPWLLANSGMQ